jgi:hypothetical protein
MKPFSDQIPIYPFGLDSFVTINNCFTFGKSVFEGSGTVKKLQLWQKKPPSGVGQRGLCLSATS